MITAGLPPTQTKNRAQVKKLGGTIAKILLNGMLKR
jgi:hypothetical protein